MCDKPGSASRLATEVTVQVQLYDLDPFDVVWHGHYMRFLEQARSALFDKMDYNYSEMRQSGYVWPVIDLRVRFVRPATFGQHLVVRAEIVEWENRLVIVYRITDETSGQRVAKARTVQVAVTVATREMCFVSPPILFQKLNVTAP